jgi:hypothetical protein
MAKRKSSVAELIGRQVVLDTAGPATYLGTLIAISDEGFWLEKADFHDRLEGHATKELYICEARQQGIRPNRHRVFVFSQVVISISALNDIIEA